MPSVQNQRLGKREPPRDALQEGCAEGGSTSNFSEKKFFSRTRFFIRGLLTRQGAVTACSEEHWITHSTKFRVKCSSLETHRAFVAGQWRQLVCFQKTQSFQETRFLGIFIRQASLSRNKDKEERLTGFYFLIKISSVPYLYQKLIK